MLERKYLNLQAQADGNNKLVLAQCGTYDDKIKAVKARVAAATQRLDAHEKDMDTYRGDSRCQHTELQDLVHNTKQVYIKANAITQKELQDYYGNLSKCQKRIDEF